MNKLKIELFRYEDLVFGRVLKMDESLRCTDIIAINSKFSIESDAKPQLVKQKLYVRGGATSQDNNAFSFQYETEEDAINACKNIKDLINEINSKDAEEEESPIIKIDFDK